MEERRSQCLQLSRPFRAEDSNSISWPWGAACGFPLGHVSLLPSGSARYRFVGEHSDIHERLTSISAHTSKPTNSTAPKGLPIRRGG
ncbi:MAG: hypothetical protein KDD67_13515 [Ignavibacteriae bacterium]|nr:hypothetical protein [Ignavibacteriota bacterium]MCB9216563.1 hypothetical protein [Ignavibacteria bacterium]